MDALSPETRREIVRRVFPDLRYGGDPDLERYFDLRKAGRLAEALSVYNGPLRARYPDDRARLLLLRLYRENDPRWVELQARLELELGERLAKRVRANIDALAAPLEGAGLSNAWKALAAAEALMRLLPRDSGEALALLERYAGFARLLSHRERLVERAGDLVREYLAMARSDAPGEYDFVARSEALEKKRREEERLRRGGEPASAGGPRADERYDFIARSEALEEGRRKEEEARARYFDLSRLSFSAADLSRIEIPEEIERKEDRVLAFCAKYWRSAADAGLERLVFLYSKKFGTRHYAVFRAVKVGRLRRFTDDEILTAVSTILSSSYSYSVSGDLYMQEAWRRLKVGLVEAERAEAEAREAAAESPAVVGRKGRAGPPKARPLAPAAERPPVARPAARAAEPRPSGRQPAARPSVAQPAARPAAPRLADRPVLDRPAVERRTPDFASRPPSFALREAAVRPQASPVRSFASAPETAPGLRTSALRSAAFEADRAASVEFLPRPSAPEPRSRAYREPGDDGEPRSRTRSAAAEAAEPRSRAASAPDRKPGLRWRADEGAAPGREAEPRSRFAARAEEDFEPRSRRRPSYDAVGDQDQDATAEAARSAGAKGAGARGADAPASARPGSKAAGSGLSKLPSGAKKARGQSLLGRQQAPEPLPELKAREGSVSDRVRKLSGKAYDVYKEIFLERVRDSIHRRLVSGKKGPRRLFDSGTNEAEDLVYAFLAEHYDDPYLDWGSSEEKRKVEALGFELPSLDPIIEAWYRKL